MRVFGGLIPRLGDVLTLELEEGAKIGALRGILLGRVERNLLKWGEELGEGGPLVVLLNGRNVETLEGNETELRDGDVVYLIPPFAGG